MVPGDGFGAGESPRSCQSMRPTERGRLIAFSGLDGAGKTTQIELLIEHLRHTGSTPRYLWTRGGYTPRLEDLKQLLRRLPGRVIPPSGPSPLRTKSLRRSWIRRLWLVAALTDLALLYGIQVRWWVWRGETVICDRYLWDTLIDLRLNFPGEAIEAWPLWRLLKQVAPEPDIALALLIPVEESLRRSKIKDEPFPDSAEVLAKRLAEYEELTEVAGWEVLDGRQPVETLAARIWTEVAVSEPVLTKFPT